MQNWINSTRQTVKTHFIRTFKQQSQNIRIEEKTEYRKQNSWGENKILVFGVFIYKYPSTALEYHLLTQTMIAE